MLNLNTSVNKINNINNIKVKFREVSEKPIFRILILFLFVCLFFLTRIPHLRDDVNNPDGVNWHYRSQQFVVGLKYSQFEKTYQHYHPGVTLMWVTGIPIEVFKQIIGNNNYDMFNFESFDFIAKFSLIVVQLVLTLYAIFLLSKRLGFYHSLGIASIFTYEIFFLGNSRLYHMDVLLALFFLISLILSYDSILDFKVWKVFLSGIFLGLNFLTKSIGIGSLFFVVFYAIYYYVSGKRIKEGLKYISILILSFSVTVFILFPALWKDPIYYLTLIFRESERVGIRGGHEQTILGNTTQDAPIWFYPLVILVKSTPFMIFGGISYLIFIVKSIFDLSFFKDYKNKLNNFTGFLTIFYLGYFVILFYPTKKIDRYMIPMFPYLAYISFLGYKNLYYAFRSWIASKYLKVITIVVFLLVFTFSYIIPLIKVYPYYFTYTSFLFGSSSSANKIIAQKSFGVGISEVKKHILTYYGYYPKLGFYDIKPIESIYPNSLVYDVRDYGPGSYDILVLSINEELPKKVESSETKFVKDSSLWINGLEYWKFYIKQK